MSTNTPLALSRERIGDSWVEVAGKGEPIIVVHGGPGLDHSYLVEWLAPLVTSRKLVFFDQRGCGIDNTALDSITVDRLVDQLVSIIDAFNVDQSATVFTHSWGAYLFYRAITALSRPVRRAILLSPVGLTRKRFEESGERLVSRIPPAILTQIDNLDKAQDGLGVMRAALPFYVANANTPPPIKFRFYSQAVFARVLETLGDYDLTNISMYLPRSTRLIYGDADIELPAATREIHEAASVTLIEGAGHFAFAERPERFLLAVHDCLNAR